MIGKKKIMEVNGYQILTFFKISKTLTPIVKKKFKNTIDVNGYQILTFFKIS